MAGLFRAPKPVVVPPQPAPPTPEASVVTPEAARIAGRASARQGTIATSAVGVLAPLPVTATRKSLLGE